MKKELIWTTIGLFTTCIFVHAIISASTFGVTCVSISLLKLLFGVGLAEAACLCLLLLANFFVNKKIKVDNSDVILHNNAKLYQVTKSTVGTDIDT